MGGAGKRFDQDGSRARRQRCAAQLAIEAAAVDVLHREEGGALVKARLVDLHDVRVPQPAECFCFVNETPLSLFPDVVGVQDHLEGDDTIEAELPRPVHDAHAAAPQLALEEVPGNEAPRSLRDRRGRGIGDGEPRTRAVRCSFGIEPGYPRQRVGRSRLARIGHGSGRNGDSALGVTAPGDWAGSAVLEGPNVPFPASPAGHLPWLPGTGSGPDMTERGRRGRRASASSPVSRQAGREAATHALHPRTPGPWKQSPYEVFFLPKRFSKSASVIPIVFSNSFSVMMGTPSSCALSSLLPASSPATTKLVFFDTLLPGLPPYAVIRPSISCRL